MILADIIIHDDRWNTVVSDVDEWVEQTLSSLAAREEMTQKSELAIVLTNDAEIQQLNAEFRGKDKATNVLSFPSGEEVDLSDEMVEALEIEANSCCVPAALGDIIMSFDTIDIEAQQQQKIFIHHATHMLIHGVLHLLGYDHIDHAEAEIMEAKEITLLELLEINNPYE